MRPNVWVVSELYYPEETSTGYFLTGIAEGLAREFDTGAICSQPTYSSRGVVAPRRETHNGVAVVRMRGTRLDPKRLRSRLVNAVTITLAAFSNLLWQVRRGNVVIVVTNPPTLPIVTRIICRLRGARCVLLVHDVYPEVLAAAGVIRAGSFVYRLLDRAFRRLYRGFDRVVVLGRDMQQLVARKVGRPAEALTIIPNWGDVEAIAPRPGANPLRERIGAEDAFLVQYGGNIGRTHGIGALLEAARTLPDVRFLVIGSGSKKRELEAAVAYGGLHNVTVIDPVPRQELPVSLNACDVALVTLVAGMRGVSVPSRTYNILAAGKPVIAMAEPDSEIGLLIAEERAGWVVPPDDARALAAAINEARSDRERLAEMGRNARAAAERAYTHEHVVDAWRTVVREVRSHG